ncbi:MAG: TRAP transporter small permease [Thermodesulfobacteriota bacterium]
MEIIVRFESAVRKVSAFVNAFGVSLLMLMMVMTCLDIVLRVLRIPITGGFELVTFVQVIFVSFALPYTEAVKGNITTELIFGRFPSRVKTVVGFFTTFLSLGLAVLITWRSALQGETLRLAGQHSVALSIPFFPFYWVIAFSAGLLALVLLANLLLPLAGRHRYE